MPLTPPSTVWSPLGGLFRKPVSAVRPEYRFRPRLERLEDRVTPTTQLFVDFGDGFTNGLLDTTVNVLRNPLSSGGLQGPDLEGIGTLGDGDAIRFRSLASAVKFDYNGDGAVNQADVNLMEADVVAAIRRYYEPLNVNVVVVASANVSDVRARLQSTVGPGSQNHTYMFVTPVFDSAGNSVGKDGGLFGISQGNDITVGNNIKDSGIAFADNLISSFRDRSAGRVIGRTTAHEAGHNFGLEHTDAGNDDEALLVGNDIILAGPTATRQVRQAINFFTRFDLPTASGNPDYAPFEFLVNDPNVGRKPGFAAYVTGTGANDRITLTRVGSTISVKVEAFRDAARTSLIRSETTVYDNSTDGLTFTNGFLIDAGSGNDEIVINGNVGNLPITVRGMGGTDRLTVNGGGTLSATYAPDGNTTTALDLSTSFGGRVSLSNGLNIRFSEFETAGGVTINGVTGFTFQGTGGRDVIQPQRLSPSSVTFTGSVNGGRAFVPVVVNGSANLTVDGGDGVDTVTVLGTAGNDSAVVRLLDPSTLQVSGTPVTVSVRNVEDFLVDLLGGVNNLVWRDASNRVYGSVNDPGSGIRFAPTSFAGGRVDAAFTSLRFANVNGDFAVNGDEDGSGDRDTFVFLGTSNIGRGSGLGETLSPDGSDQIVASDTSVSISNAVLGTLRSVRLETPGGQARFAALVVRAGNDARGDNVTATPSNRLNLFLDGMSPGQTPGDRINPVGFSSVSFVRSTDPNLGPAHTRLVDPATGASLGYIRFENFAGSPPSLHAVAPDAGAPGIVQVFAGNNPNPFRILNPYPGFLGGVRVAVGDVNGDGFLDVVTAPGAGAPALVMVFDGRTGGILAEFFAYAPGFLGGANLAVADVDGDGFGDIITGADGLAPHVKVFSGLTGAEIRSFYAYVPGAVGGVRVAGGDVNGDGFADIITGVGPGGGPHVKVFSGANNAELSSFFAYAPTFTGGVFVAAGDMNGDGLVDVLTTPGLGGAPDVRAFGGPGMGLLFEFLAYDGAPAGVSAVGSIALESGLRIATADVDGDGVREVLLVKGKANRPVVRAYRVTPFSQVFALSVFDPSSFAFGLVIG